MKPYEIEPLVYRHVFGWHQPPRYTGFGGTGGPLPWLDADGKLARTMAPAQTIAGAWEVVERMRELGWRVKIADCRIARGHYDVAFRKDGKRVRNAIQDNVATAICRAALKAVGVEVGP